MFMGYQDHHVVPGIHGAPEVMGDEQHSAPEITADLLDELMEPFRPGEIDALIRLVEDQQLGAVNQRPREEQPLKLPSRQGGDGWIAEPLQAYGGERGVDLAVGKAAGQGHEPAKGQG